MGREEGWGAFGDWRVSYGVRRKLRDIAVLLVNGIYFIIWVRFSDGWGDAGSVNENKWKILLFYCYPLIRI